MLIDKVLPVYDASVVCELRVDASAERAWDAVLRTDLRDPVVRALFAAGRTTFAGVPTMRPGWVPLGELPGVEFVVGSVGRFWRRDFGAGPVATGGFVHFREPGYAKLAISLAVRPTGNASVLRYEARTLATDLAARRRFLRYWRLAGPGAGIVMRRVLKKIKADAEQGAMTGMSP